MKKNLTALLAAFLLLTTATFARDNEKPTLQVQNEFHRMFAHATEVKWEAVGALHKVTFVQGEQYLTAYFNTDGEFESVSRNISTHMLPLLLQKGLRDLLTNAWVSESFEVSGTAGTKYYVAIENANGKVLYSSNSTDWSVYKTIQK